MARRHRLLPSQLTMWRRYAREGRLALPEEAPGWARPTEFVPLLLEGSASAVSHRLSARSSRHARQDAFDIWAACTTELSA